MPKITIPQPVYSSEGITLYCNKCEDVLPYLEAGSVDGVITDPPFGLGYKYNEHQDGENDYGAEGYGAWLWERLETAEGLCKPGSPVMVWQAMPHCRHFHEWFPRDWRLFAGIKNYVQMYPSVAMQFCWDPVVTWWTRGKKWLGPDVYRARDFHVGNTAVNGSMKHTFEAEHSCPRPLDTLVHVLCNWVRTDGVVLDPFLGSGTTAIACWKTNRKCIGIEKDRKYVDLAIKRIEDAKGAGFVTEVRRQMAVRARKRKPSTKPK